MVSTISLPPANQPLHDAEEALRSELLRQLLIGSAILTALYLALGYAGYVRTFLFPWSAFELLTVIGIATGLLRRKRIALATVLLLTFLSHPIGFVIADYGLNTPAPALLLPTILACGLLIGRKKVAQWSVVCGAILLWDAFVRHELSAAHAPKLGFWLVMYAVMGWLTALFSVHLERLLATTRAVEEAERVAVVAERTRMARELHDNLAQGFTGILMQLNAAEAVQRQKPEALQHHLDQARALARQSLDEARLSVWALRTHGSEDLGEQIRTIANRLLRHTEIELTLVSEGQPYPLSPDTQLNVLRIAQEAITNAVRHAQAHQISITLRYQASSLELRVTDDGVGLEQPAPLGFGLKGMKERAALLATELLIHSEGGVTIQLTVPRT